MQSTAYGRLRVLIQHKEHSRRESPAALASAAETIINPSIKRKGAMTAPPCLTITGGLSIIVSPVPDAEGGRRRLMLKSISTGVMQPALSLVEHFS